MKNRKAGLSDAVAKLMAKGKYNEAYPACLKLMKLVSASEGPASREAARVHNRLGLCLLEMKEHKRAEKELQKAVALMDKNEDWAQSTDKAYCLVNMGFVKHAYGKHEACNALFIQAAAILKALLKPDEEAIVLFLRTFGDLTAPAESGEELPQRIARRAIWLTECMYGTGYLPCLPLAKLADNYEADGEKQEEAYQILLYLQNRYYGLFGQFSQPHADIGYRLAPYFDSKGDYATMMCYDDELRIQERMFEPDLDRVGTCLDRLAKIHLDCGQTDESEAKLMQLLSLLRERSPKSTHLPDILDRLAAIHLDRDEYATAVREQEEAVALSGKIKSDKAGLLERLYHLGNIYEQQGRYEDGKAFKKALLAYEQTLRMAQQIYGKKHEFIADVLDCLAKVHSNLHGEKRSVSLYERSLSIRRAVQGAKHPSVGETMNDLALVYIHMKDYRMAEGLLRKALSVLEAAHGTEGQQLTCVLNNLGLTLTSKGEPLNAIAPLERAIRIVENEKGADSPELIHYLKNLGGFWALAGKPVQAVEVYRRAILIAGKGTGGQADWTEDLQNELLAIKAGTFNERTAGLILVESGA